MSATPTPRILSIDALRGLVMLLMLVDHVREFFYFHLQVGDPMDVANTPPDLFFTRLTSHLCAPVFVFLSGLSAFLYGQKHGSSRRRLSGFLLRRGLFLVVLEVTAITFAWTFVFPPHILYLQVIWAIGLSMMVLSALIWLRVPLIAAIGMAMVAGHNAFDSVHFPPESVWYIPWAILHDRSVIALTDSISARTSYPILPWIGLMALGYACGKLFLPSASAANRERALIGGFIGLLALFVILRITNLYGETQDWQAMDSTLHGLMSFLNLTKYSPSLLFLLLTMSFAALIGWWLERRQHAQLRWMLALCVFGRVPLFFYIAHLYLLHGLYLLALALLGPNQGERFGFSSVWMIWVAAAAAAPIMYILCHWFLNFKSRHPDRRWLSYF